jgi:hypothetical protein
MDDVQKHNSCTSHLVSMKYGTLLNNLWNILVILRTMFVIDSEWHTALICVMLKHFMQMLYTSKTIL